MTTKVTGLRLPEKYTDMISDLKDEINATVPYAADTNRTVVMRALDFYNETKPFLDDSQPNLDQLLIAFTLDKTNLDFLKELADEEGLSIDSIVNSILYKYKRDRKRGL